MRIVITLGALVLMALCAPAPDGEWAGTIEDRDGVVWVSSPGADSEPEDAAPPFALHLEQTFGAEEAPEQELLAFITDAAVDGAGNVYVVDRGNNRLVAFAPDGGLLWSAGRVGQGPGEFDGAGRVAWDGADLLYVDNHHGRQIDTWTTSGQFVGSQGLATFDIPQGYVVGLPDPTTIVLWAWSRMQGDGAAVHVFDISDGWQPTSEFFALGGRLADTEKAASWGNATVRLVGDRVWVGNRLRYELREYDLGGALQRVIARDHKPLIPTFDYKGTGFGLGEFEPPSWLKDGHGLIPRHWTIGMENAEEVKRWWDQVLAAGSFASDELEYDSAIDLVDAEGRVLGSVAIGGPFYDSIGRLLFVGPDGGLYTSVHDPYPHVRRYRVEVLGAPRQNRERAGE